MKILFITRKYPPSTGGMELFARDLSAALSVKSSLKLVKWSYQGRRRAVVIGLPYLFIRSLSALLGGKIDLIHAQDTVVAPIAYCLAKLFRKPFVVIVHGLDVTYKNRLFRASVPAAVKRADAVICISSAAAESAKAAGISAAKLHIIPLAVHDSLHGLSDRVELLKQLKLPDDSKIIVTVGRLVKRKGAAWFIDNVLPELSSRYRKLVYVVIGEGADRANIEAATTRQELKGRVRLLGKASPGTLAAAYNGADVFVMPNIPLSGDMEGFGLVLLEAALCARAIVASNLEGIKDAIKSGRNGVLVSPLDATAFATAISLFLDDKAYARQFGTASRQYTLENYQWDRVGNRYIDIYRQLLGLQSQA